jgi:CO/xanthine dehydrogenase Mo-binding subunit
MDFLMPYASEVPDIDIDHQQTPSPLNPLGIKGAGEAGVIPGTAAIASAIEDAVGRRIASMPISPTELYDLVRSPDSEMTAAAARRAGTGVMA